MTTAPTDEAPAPMTRQQELLREHWQRQITTQRAFVERLVSDLEDNRQTLALTLLQAHESGGLSYEDLATACGLSRARVADILRKARGEAEAEADLEPEPNGAEVTE